MNILFDTNFIMGAAKMKIDFIAQAKEKMGFARVLIPSQVIEELEKISDDKKQKLADREIASTALEIIDKNDILIIDLEDEIVDRGIKHYMQKYDDISLATLDRGLKNAIRKGVKFIGLKKGKGLVKA